MPDPNCKRCGGTGIENVRGYDTKDRCPCTWATKAPPSPESRLDAIERRQRMLAGAVIALCGIALSLIEKRIGSCAESDAISDIATKLVGETER